MLLLWRNKMRSLIQIHDISYIFSCMLTLNPSDPLILLKANFC